MAVEVRGEPGESAARQKVAQHLRLAEQLGAEVHTLIGANVAQTILDYARSRNVTKIVVGKTAQPWWNRLAFGTVIDQLLEKSGDIDVYVIRGEPETSRATQAAPQPAPIAWSHYLATATIVALCGAAGTLGHVLHDKPAEANTAMVFLFGVAVVALWFGRGPAIFASVSSVLVFDFFFVPPTYSLGVQDAQYFVTFAVMLTIGVLISTLTARVRERLRFPGARTPDRGAVSLHQATEPDRRRGISHQLGGAATARIFAGDVVLYLRAADGPLSLRFGADTPVARMPVNAVVAQWVADHDQSAGLGTDTLPSAAPSSSRWSARSRPSARSAFAPTIHTVFSTRSSAAFWKPAPVSSLSPSSAINRSSKHTKRSCACRPNSCAACLLSSVSHDLRTPLAAIAGTADSLLATAAKQHDPMQAELLQSIVTEAHRLARLVDNLLDMTRLESGAVVLNKEWHVLEEIVGSARTRLRSELERHQVRVDIPSDLPLLLFDGVLLEQAVGNILENAARYTPAGSTIDITARIEDKQLSVRIADNGPGLPPGSESHVFEKFYRGAAKTADGRRGVGLGLAICQAVATAHGGSISARNRPGGGAEFELRLPCVQTAPRVVVDQIPVARV